MAEVTVEEAILGPLARKHALAHVLFEGITSVGPFFDQKAIEDLFHPLKVIDET